MFITYTSALTMRNSSRRSRQVIPSIQMWCMNLLWTIYLHLQRTHDLYLVCNSLQGNWLLATKYFVTESLNFVYKNIPQRKFFRALFVALDPSLKVSWQKSYFVAQSFPWWNKILSLKVFSNEIFHRQK